MILELSTLLVVLLVFFVLFFLLNSKLNKLQKPTNDQALLEWLKSMQQSVETTNKSLNQALSNNSNHMVTTLQENTKQLNERLDKAASVIRAVGVEVGQMSEIGRSMKELQEFLKSPKMRGTLGEEVLKDMISQLFPKNSFHLQYQFKSGERVDAAIQTDAGILPIDSKFPLDNFALLIKAETKEQKESAQKELTKDVKRHIDDIAHKYILPDEGTMDFALMYVPSESIYYELINIPPLMSYARQKRVYLVSPSTLYANLQTILLSFEGKKIELRSKEVFKILRTLLLDYQKINANLEILGRHLNNAQTQFGNVSGNLSQLGRKIESANQLELSPNEKPLLS